MLTARSPNTWPVIWISSAIEIVDLLMESYEILCTTLLYATYFLCSQFPCPTISFAERIPIVCVGVAGPHIGVSSSEKHMFPTSLLFLVASEALGIRW